MEPPSLMFTVLPEVALVVLVLLVVLEPLVLPEPLVLLEPLVFVSGLRSLKNTLVMAVAFVPEK